MLYRHPRPDRGDERCDAPSCFIEHGRLVPLGARANLENPTNVTSQRGWAPGITRAAWPLPCHGGAAGRRAYRCPHRSHGASSSRPRRRMRPVHWIEHLGEPQPSPRAIGESDVVTLADHAGLGSADYVAIAFVRRSISYKDGQPWSAMRLADEMSIARAQPAAIALTAAALIGTCRGAERARPGDRRRRSRST